MPRTSSPAENKPGWPVITSAASFAAPSTAAVELAQQLGIQRIHRWPRERDQLANP